MDQEKGFLTEFDNYKLYLLKIKSQNQQKNQTYVFKISNSKNSLKYQRQVTLPQDLPLSAQKIFTKVEDFVKAFEILVSQRKSSKNTSLVWIDEHAGLNLNFSLSIMGKIKANHLVRLQMFESGDPAKLQQLSRRVSDLQKQIQTIIGSKLKEKELSPNIIHYQSPLLDQNSNDSKKKIKESKQTQKNSKSFEIQISNKMFKIEDKKVIINQQLYRIEAALTSKNGNQMSIAVQINVHSNNLTYTGELSDLQIKEFLSQPTKLKNSKQLFQEIKKNAKKQIKDALKVNQRENKLEILIVLPSSSPKNQKQESIFAQIDIKLIKQQIQDLKNSTSKINEPKQMPGKSLSSPVSKQKIIDNIRSSVLKFPNKDIQKLIQKSTKSTKKGQPLNQRSLQKQPSQMSFRTRKTAIPKSAQKRLQDISFNENSMFSYNDHSVDMSLSMSYQKKSFKTAKGFLLNKQHQNFIIHDKVIQLKQKIISCALLSKKIPRKNFNLEFLIRIKKVAENLIIGIATDQVGVQNNFMHQHFVGFSPLDGFTYQNGIKKQDKLSQIKGLKQNSEIKVRVNLKNRLIQWYLKEENIDKENWKLIKEYMMPVFMQVRDLYPTVFLRNAGDKVEFIIPK